MKCVSYSLSMKIRILVFQDYLYLLQCIVADYLGYVVNPSFIFDMHHVSSFDSMERKALVSLDYLCLFNCKVSNYWEL